MAFRADEAAQQGYEDIENYLVPGLREVTKEQRVHSKSELQKLADELGPAVAAYPTWHPLVAQHDTSGHPITSPSERCGYKGLDHTRYFANGFISCPYGDGQKIIDSVENLSPHPLAKITAERLDDVILYHPNTTPIVVRCNWNEMLLADGTIPLSMAIPLILENEVPTWRGAQVGETWESMRPYFLGRPHGSRSSLFVNQETGQGIKKVWTTLINTGMFGPIKV